MLHGRREDGRDQEGEKGLDSRGFLGCWVPAGRRMIFTSNLASWLAESEVTGRVEGFASLALDARRRANLPPCMVILGRWDVGTAERRTVREFF